MLFAVGEERFDQFADALAEGITGMARRALIDTARATTRVLRHVRGARAPAYFRWGLYASYPQQGARDGDAARCAALVDCLEARCLKPALAALRAGVIERVRLVPGDAIEYALDRRGLARWWRRARSLDAHWPGTP